MQPTPAAATTGLTLYWRYVQISVRSQLQYRASFILTLLANLVATGIEFLGIWAMFARFGSLNGWRLPEVALFYGVVNVAFAIAEALGRGFDTFPNLVKSGDFDRLLLRPRSTTLQVSGSDVQLMRVGRLAQGLVVMAWALNSIGAGFTLPVCLVILSSLICGVGIFVGLFVIQAALSFWTIDSLEIMNTVTYGGTETAQYPLTIYRPWFRRFFTLVVPLAFVNYLPLSLILKDHRMPGAFAAAIAAPAVGALFVAVSLLAWRAGVRHYHSTGS